MSTAKEHASLQTIGKGAAEGIADMVAALECDYDRLEELKALHDDDDIDLTDDESEELKALEKAAGDCESREDAEQRIYEDPLSIEVRSGWYPPGEMVPAPEEFAILLGTGGPATRIRGTLDEHGEPTRAWIEAQDWGTPWTQCFNVIDQETLLTYCRCFYVGS